MSYRIVDILYSCICAGDQDVQTIEDDAGSLSLSQKRRDGMSDGPAAYQLLSESRRFPMQNSVALRNEVRIHADPTRGVPTSVNDS